MRIATVVAVALLGTTCLAGPDRAKAEIQHYQLNIPRESLDTALKDLAQQTGLQIGRFSGRVDGSAMVGPVAGAQTPTEALKTLLRDTGLDYKIVSDTTVAVYNPKDTAAPTPEPTPQQKQTSKEGTQSNSFWDRFRVAQAAQGTAVTSSNEEAKRANSSTATETPSPGSAGSPNKLEEIVVTAQKREERLQDVPTSIEVLSAAKLQEQGVEQFSDLVKHVPGLNLIGGSGPGQGEIVLRGISTGGDSSSLVGVYLDDVPFTPSSNRAFVTGFSFLLDPDLGDIERIEVLEGPQSTLYGASAMGGLVKFVTKQPDLNNYDGDVRVQGSQVDGGGAGYGVRGSVNIPVVSDEVGLRASAFYRRDPGFVDNTYYDRDNVNSADIEGGRASLRVKFSDALETVVSGLLQDIDGNGPNLVYLNPTTLKPLAGDLSYSSAIYQPNTIHFRMVSDTTKFAMPFATLTNIASYAEIGSDKISDYGGYTGFIDIYASAPPGTGISYEATPQSKRYTDELRLASAPGRFEWLLAGFYTYEKDVVPIDMRARDSIGALLPPSSPYSDVYTYVNTDHFREKAVFGDLTYHFTDQFEGTVGTRYSSNTQSFNVVTDGLLGTENHTAASDDSAETYLVTFSYKLQPSLTTYARVASAYRPGGGNFIEAAAGPGLPQSFSPDKLWNYEVGLKGSLLDGRASFSADVFHMRWLDVQLEESLNGFGFETNGASAKSDGAEAAFEVTPLERLTLSLQAAYTDAKITADVPSIGAHDGDPLPYASKVQVSAVGDYRFVTLNGVTPTAGLSYSYHGAESTGYSNGINSGTSVSYRLPSYYSLDLRGGFDWSNYSVRARVDNVTNEFGITSALPLYGPGFPLGGTVVRPRTFGLSFEARF